MPAKSGKIPGDGCGFAHQRQRPDNITRANNMLKRMTAIGIENLGVEANSKEFRKILREERKRSAAARESLKQALRAARKEVNEENKMSEAASEQQGV